MKTIKVELLKTRDEIKKVTSINKPGWYLWYCSYENLKKLLDSPYITGNYFDTLLEHLTTKKIEDVDYYCIYAGVSIKRPLWERINWHVNDRHDINSVKNGTLSTLRKSFSSLLFGDQSAKDGTNSFIYNLYIEYEEIDEETGSEQSKAIIDEAEKQQLKEKCLPINIMGNKNPYLQSFTQELRLARKKSKIKALENSITTASLDSTSN